MNNNEFGSAVGSMLILMLDKAINKDEKIVTTSMPENNSREMLTDSDI